MITAILPLLRVVPVWAWVIAAVLGWGGIQKFKATQATKEAARAEAAAVANAEVAKLESEYRQKETTAALQARKDSDEYNRAITNLRRLSDAVRADRERLLILATSNPAASAASGVAAASRGADAASLRIVVRESTAALAEVAEAADREAARVVALQKELLRTRSLCLKDVP